MSNINPGKAVKSLFTLPEPPKTTPTPKVDNQAVQTAAVEAVQRRNRSRGYRSTILSQLLSGNESTAGGGSSPLRTTIGS